MHTLPVGTLVSRPKDDFLKHVGVVTELGTIFHNTPERGEHDASLAAFAEGKPVTVCGRVRDFHGFFHRLAQRRAERRKYDTLLNNCEHTVSALSGETPASPQLLGWFIFTVLAGVAVIALSRK